MAAVKKAMKIKAILHTLSYPYMPYPPDRGCGMSHLFGLCSLKREVFR